VECPSDIEEPEAVLGIVCCNIIKVKQTRYRPRKAQRVPGS